MALKLTAPPGSASRAVTVALPLLVGVLGLWGLVATILMLGQVHGSWRALLNYILGSLFLFVLVMLFRTFAY